MSAGKRPDPGAVAAAARPEGKYAERVVVRDGREIRVFPLDAIDALQDFDFHLMTLFNFGPPTQTGTSLRASMYP